MDIDAEMQKLQAEARKRLAEESPQLPATPIPESVKAANAPLDAEALVQAAKLAEAAVAGGDMSLGAKIGWSLAAVVAFAIVWSLLAPVISALISVAILVLIVMGILKIAGFFDKAADEEDTPAT